MSPPTEDRVEQLLVQMTLAEKIGQMTQAEKNSITPEQVADHTIGSVLSGGGGNPIPNTSKAWADMVRRFQEGALRSRLGVPLLYGVDAVHGHSNLHGATIFPHNIGLGATRNPELVERIAAATARELLATNVHWNFAPAVSVPQDIRWGRTYEGFSEDPALVAELGAAYVRGLQGGERPVLASVKHFIGDGGTAWGSTPRYEWISDLWRADDGHRWQLDQGNTEGDEAALLATHLPPYIAAIEAGARNIMVSYSSWNGVKMHSHRELLTGLLKERLGFDGFLVSDWYALVQLDADPMKATATAINAGLDMVMVPFQWREFIAALHQLVERGDVPMARIDDAVRRILRVKVELGLFDQPFGEAEWLAEVGSAAHRALAREAVRQSLVLLKNERGTLPLPRTAGTIRVAGRAADDIGLQCGGWTIEWQGGTGAITPGTTLLEALRHAVAAPQTVRYAADGRARGSTTAAVGLVVLSEPPYAEGEGDRADLSLDPEQVALVARLRAQCERLVVVLFSGRPLLVDEVLAQADAFIAAWLPGTEAQGIGDALFGLAPFTGRLPYTWPDSLAGARDESPRFPLGFGLRTTAVPL